VKPIGDQGEGQGVQLDQAQWASITQGMLQTPDGSVWRRQTTRASRRVCDELLAQGIALVVHWYGGGELRLYGPAEAPAAWRRLRGQVTVDQPDPRRGKVAYTAGLWSDGHDGRLLVLTGHC
jgi:hypothetical protein